MTMVDFFETGDYLLLNINKMKMKLKSKEFEISWIEIASLLVTVYLLATDNISVIMEFIKSHLK